MNFAGKGYLQVILGPMFSGKTTHLLDIEKKYKVCDVSCCVINYAEDRRYHNTLLSTHDKQMTHSLNIHNLWEIFTSINLQDYEVFLINEGQFFKGLYETVKSLVEKHKKTVYVCGLDGDYQRKQFGEILNLIPLADEIVKKKALCMGCRNGTKGIFTQRITKEIGQTIIGSNNYRSVCRNCFNKTT